MVECVILMARCRALTAPITSPRLRRLRIVAFTGPLAFAVAVGLLTDLVLERAFPSDIAHLVATGVVAAGALIFTLWIFGVLTDLYNRLEEAARLEERQRIAMKLHDDVIQSVYGVQLTLEASLTELQASAVSTNHYAINQAIEDLDRIVVRVRRHILEEDLAVTDPDGK